MKVYEYIIRIKDQATDKIAKLARNVDNGRTRLGQFSQSATRAEGATKNFGNAASNATAKINKFNQSVQQGAKGNNEFASSLGFISRYLGPAAIALGMLGFAKNASALAASFEQTRISFEVMIGSAKNGRSLLSEIETMAVQTPFKSSDLQSSGKLLLGFGISAQKILPTLRMLGDISGGNAEKLHFLSLAFAQSQAAGRLMGQDLLQMVNAGFNPLQTISEKTGISIGVLKEKMAEGAITADIVAAAFKSATEEGGRFHNMMERQSQTFEGRMNALGEKWEIWIRGIGSKLNEKLAPYLDKAIEIIDRWIDPLGAAQNLVDKQTSDFKRLYTTTTPLIARYEQLAAIQKKSKKEQAEMLSITEKIGKAIPLSVKDRSGTSVKSVDLNKAKSYLAEQDAIFKAGNGTGQDAAMNEAQRIRNQITELNEDYKILQRDDGYGTMGLNRLRTKYLDDNRSQVDVWMGVTHKSDGISEKLKQALQKGDHNTILGAYAEEMQRLNEEAAKFESRMSKLRNDKVGVYLKDKDGEEFDWKKAGQKINGSKDKDGVDKITGGGKQAINVTINIDTLNGIQNVESINGNGNLDVKELKKMIEKYSIEAVLEAVNSANYAQAQ